MSTEVSHTANRYMKVRFVLVHTLKAYGGVNVKLHSFLTLALDESE